jgi:hypothetical protein
MARLVLSDGVGGKGAVSGSRVVLGAGVVVLGAGVGDTDGDFTAGVGDAWQGAVDEHVPQAAPRTGRPEHPRPHAPGVPTLAQNASTRARCSQ